MTSNDRVGMYHSLAHIYSTPKKCIRESIVQSDHATIGTTSGESFVSLLCLCAETNKRICCGFENSGQEKKINNSICFDVCSHSKKIIYSEMYFFCLFREGHCCHVIRSVSCVFSLWSPLVFYPKDQTFNWNKSNVFTENFIQFASFSVWIQKKMKKFILD